MAIPNQPQFESFLSELSLERPLAESSKRNLLVKTKQWLEFHDGRNSERAAILLWFDDSSGISMEAFRRKLRSELQERGHVSSDEVLVSVLAAFVALFKSAQNKVAAMNSVLESIVPVDVSHFWAYPSPRVDWYGTWKGWRWGMLNSDLLRSRCRRAGSDYWELWGKRLESVCTTQSPDFRRSVINWGQHCATTRRGDPGTAAGDLILNYFETTSTKLEEMAWQDLDQRQALLAAFDLDVFRMHKLREIPFVHKVTVYLGFENPIPHGYVCPMTTAPHMNWMPPDGEPLQRAREFEAKHLTGELPNTELGATIRSVARYAQLARECHRQREFSDSLLNAVIALEILFSEKEATTTAISTRTAVLIHHRVGKSFQEVRDEVSRLYDERSNFVHRGKLSNQEIAEKALATLQQILLCLFQFQRREGANADWTLKNWLKKLDWVKASIEAGIPIPDSLLTENGILLDQLPPQ